MVFGRWDSSQWDTAAGIVLVREAGGFISDLEGGETYWDSGDICAANPKAWREIIKELRPAIIGPLLPVSGTNKSSLFIPNPNNTEAAT